jgi:hypothetical protein
MPRLCKSIVRPCQDRPNWSWPKPQIGRRARRLPPTQEGHICMESGKNVEHLLGDRRAHPQHQAWLQACQAGPAALQLGQVPDHGRRVIKDPGC